MAKKKYLSPVLLDLTPGDDPVIPVGTSQGTSGDDPVYSWDPEIDDNDIDMFWLSYDETDLPGIDTDGDLVISKDEFDAWLDSIGGW